VRSCVDACTERAITIGGDSSIKLRRATVLDQGTRRLATPQPLLWGWVGVWGAKKWGVGGAGGDGAAVALVEADPIVRLPDRRGQPRAV
jgi:hypothetical protein